VAVTGIDNVFGSTMGTTGGGGGVGGVTTVSIFLEQAVTNNNTIKE
jgi:hypothetical protein